MKEKKEKEKLISQNKFEVLASSIMSCKVELRRQETEKEWVAVSSTVKRDTKVGNILREREKKRRKKQHMQLSHKKHNKRRGD